MAVLEAPKRYSENYLQLFNHFLHYHHCLKTYSEGIVQGFLPALEP